MPDTLLRILLAAALLVAGMLATCPPVAAGNLLTAEVDGISLHYPPASRELAARLQAEIPAIRAFLESRALPLRPPVQVTLDATRDRPGVDVHMTPHRGVRIPLRAPGVLEDGYTESDPWVYFLFRGLSLQAVYDLRAGLPGRLHTVFGAIVSPNVIFPPWATDGLSHLLYGLYRGQPSRDPMAEAIFAATRLPDLDTISNHPETWPGPDTYRIYGRPFVQWLYRRFGWERLQHFLFVHGRGILPIEIDFKAHRTLGATWAELWEQFRRETPPPATAAQGAGLLATGFWPQPLTYWNDSGLFPGAARFGQRGRYGYRTLDGTLRLSFYDPRGVARLIEDGPNAARTWPFEHVWDPGPGAIAVSRKDHQPFLVGLPALLPDGRRPPVLESVSPPPGAIALSGPVRAPDGRIAVAANCGGNWDIWVHAGDWRRITHGPAVDMDPWWQDDRLVYVSARSGRFQVHAADGTQLTTAAAAAVLPRSGRCLQLTPNGWQVVALPPVALPPLAPPAPARPPPAERPAVPALADEHPYRPWRSLRPDYVIPDLFFSDADRQYGLATAGRDVSGTYTLDAGFRWDQELERFSWRLTAGAGPFGTRYTRYPLAYAPVRAPAISELRQEVSLAWTPRAAEALTLALNWRSWHPLTGAGQTQDETWASLGLKAGGRQGRWWLDLDLFREDSRSLFGGLDLRGATPLPTAFYLHAGKTWGEAHPGHNTFRIGGDLQEGYFTRRPSRLFPLRGFAGSLLESTQAVTAGAEIFWPLANLQRGYQALPLFLHRLQLGTFVDAGICTPRPSSDDLLLSAGVELVTSLEIAWDYLSIFRLGVAWPLQQPDYLESEGPVFLLQLGRPL